MPILRKGSHVHWSEQGNVYVITQIDNRWNVINIYTGNRLGDSTVARPTLEGLNDIVYGGRVKLIEIQIKELSHA